MDSAIRGQTEHVQVSPSGINVSERDLADLDETDFDAVWAAIGKIYRARGRRQMAEERQRREIQIAMPVSDQD